MPFLEAILFKKPILVNRYSIYIKDIEPKGFNTISMNDYLTDKNVEKVKKVLEDENYRKEMVENNYKIGEKYFSYDVLKYNLKQIIRTIFG